MKLFLHALLFLISGFSFSQVLVINELDSDTPSIDDKEFVELLSETPNFPLDGYVLVFFNGSTAGANSSYLAIDLDGLQTDINGLLLIGSNSVSPVPQKLIAPNLIQNGADAVAIYQRDDLDFEFPTLAFVDNTLVDVLVYGTNDPDATGMLDIFRTFNPDIQQINEGAANNTNSIQRFVDGNGVVSYLSTVPTPRQLNDGSGIVLNGIFIGVLQTQYNEGDSFDITLTSEQPVSQDLTLSISLNNGSFNSFDYSGNSSLTILNGQNTTSTTLTIIDDNFDEGDEVMKVTLSGLPPTFLALNNNLQIRAIDNDFQIASFGTPINPTFGTVTSTQPNGYYDSLDGLSGTVLRQALQDIVANPAIVRAQTYNDVIDILKEADQNPENSNQVWLVYLEKGRAKLDFQTTSNNTGTWNREHTFPRSRAGYNSIQADGISDGKNIYWTTNADSLRHGNSDAHALRAVDGPENSSRGNQFYGEYTGPVGTLGGFKGDVARSVFYMAIRYNGLEIVNGFPDGLTGQFGDLATLLDWHRNDPPDDFEMNRNNVVFQWQLNRNPFIDQPDLVEYIWGNKVGQIWQQALSVEDFSFGEIKLYPNPVSDFLNIKGVKETLFLKISTIDGRILLSKTIHADTQLNLNYASGMYFITLSASGKSITKKIVVK